MTLSLRGRLLIGVISLMAIGLLVSGIVTYALLEKSLYDRIDSQLAARSTHDTARLVLSQPNCFVRGPGAATDFPAGSITELLVADGTVSAYCTLGEVGTASSAPQLELPSPLPAAGIDQSSTPFTVRANGSEIRYRATVWREDSFNNEYVMFAIPLTDTYNTLSSLLLVEVVIGLGVIAATALMAFFIIDLGLRPLRRMGAVAGEIAAGDLALRVHPATRNTEIGRLGLALNAMLAQIETAFAQRRASEQRLRRFIADASHELRTPLTSIRGYSEMLRRGAQESAADSDLARRRIEEESVRMSALVDDMLLIARLDQGRPLETKPVNLQAIAGDAAADARAVAPQRQISVEAPGPVVVTGDDTRLRQVLANLVRNALVHTPSGSPIEIIVSTQNGTGHISVADHGPGLQPEDRERIFEPFYRADPSRSRDSGGAGLGLSIVSAVVAAHGGRVEIKETSGGGATFDVALPLAPSSPN